jgi:hypothetical protein
MKNIGQYFRRFAAGFTTKAEGSDRVEELVLAAITAVQSGNRDDIEAAFEALAPVETGDVLAELCLWIEDLTAGVTQESLLQATELPVPPRSPEILKAAVDGNLAMLQTAVGSQQLEKVFSSLLVLVAALKDARTRL